MGDYNRKTVEKDVRPDYLKKQQAGVEKAMNRVQDIKDEKLNDDVFRARLAETARNLQKKKGLTQKQAQEKLSSPARRGGIRSCFLCSYGMIILSEISYIIPRTPIR